MIQKQTITEMQMDLGKCGGHNRIPKFLARSKCFENKFFIKLLSCFYVKEGLPFYFQPVTKQN